MYVAVARDKFQRGVRLGRANDVTPAFYEVLTLDDALARPYATDAHMVGYIIRPDPELPLHSVRVCKGSEHLAPGPIEFWTVLVDVDNPGHVPWTPELRAQADALWAKPEMASAYVYMTKNGWRYAQPFTEPVPYTHAEALIRRALASLLLLGVRPDTACRDWTRHMRMPHVVRQDVHGKSAPYLSPFLKMGHAIPPPVLDAGEILPQTEAKPRARRGPSPTRFTVTVPDAYADLAKQLGKELSQLAEGWHKAYLAVSGALLTRGVLPEAVPAIIHAAALAEGSHKPDEHRRAAIDTTRRWADGATLLGSSYVRTVLPQVDQILERFFRPAPPPSAYMTADEAAGVLKDVLRNPLPGVTVVSASCGVGKTHATREVFAERARASLPRGQAKSVLSVPTHALALQVQADLQAAGVPCQRWFSPVTLKRPDGTPVCIHAGRAAPLIAGGQSIQVLFCKTCTVQDTCPAKAGVEGDGAIVIGAHPRLRALAEHASNGLLVVDEPPPSIQHTPVTEAELTAVLVSSHLFEDRYAHAMSFALIQARALLAKPNGTEVPIRSLFPRGLPALMHPPAPPLKRSTVAAAKSSDEDAAHIGALCATLLRFYNGHVHNGKLTVDRKRLVLSAAHDGMRAACDRTERTGPTVLLDANADLRLPEVEAIAGYAPRFVAVQAKDAGPVERVRYTAKATRGQWLEGGKLLITQEFLDALRFATTWSSTRPGPIAVVAWKVVEDALRLALEGGGEPEIRELVGPWKGALLGHYGALRGLDHMKVAAQIVTFGDPWPEIGTAAVHAAQIGLTGDALESRPRAEAAAELEQAHGRLRLPRRTAPAWALHVGRVVPGGYGWADCHVVTPARAMGAVWPLERLERLVATADHDVGGGVQKLAELVGVDASYLYNHALADRPLPAKVAAKLAGLEEAAKARGSWRP